MDFGATPPLRPAAGASRSANGEGSIWSGVGLAVLDAAVAALVELLTPVHLALHPVFGLVSAIRSMQLLIWIELRWKCP